MELDIFAMPTTQIKPQISELCKHNLLQIKDLVSKLSDSQYSCSTNFLFGASIGKHVRHILEFYLSLLDTKHTKTVNYDSRNRDEQLENSTYFALFTIDKICSNLFFAATFEYPGSICLKLNPTKEANIQYEVDSTFERELVYNLEHSIHHQALIKVGLCELDLLHLVDKNFGIAPSTLRNNNKLFNS